jgi:hypothetical protein
MELLTAGYGAAELDWLVRCFSLPGALALAGAVLLGGLLAGRAHPHLVTGTLLWVLAHELFYRLAAVPFAPWYHVTTLIALLWIAALGAARLVATTPALPSSGRERLARCAAAGTLVLALATATPGVLWVRGQWRQPPDPRLAIYARVGEFLAAQPRGTVAAIEIGVLGYYARQPILDLVGLVSEATLDAQRAGGLADLLAREPPDYAVAVERYADRFPLARWLGARPDFREIARFDDLASGRGSIRVLAREPTPARSVPQAPPPIR